jgi:dolichol-phosphate mannosyltransferase
MASLLMAAFLYVSLDFLLSSLRPSRLCGESLEGKNVTETLVCTVLPTYNERNNIGPLVEGVLASAITPHLVLVVDDNSPDGTWQVVETLMARHNTPDCLRVALLRRTDEKGLTSAIQRGIDTAIYTFGASIVTWMDCDLSMPPEDVPRLVQALLDGADVAVGSRWIAGGADVAHGRMARTLSWIINTAGVLLIGPQVHDYTSGFIAARAPVLQAIRLRGDYGEYCIDLLGRALHQGRRVVEIPYRCVPRSTGESKTGANLWDYLVKGRKYVTTIWQVRRGGRLST